MSRKATGCIWRLKTGLESGSKSLLLTNENGRMTAAVFFFARIQTTMQFSATLLPMPTSY